MWYNFGASFHLQPFLRASSRSRPVDNTLFKARNWDLSVVTHLQRCMLLNPVGTVLLVLLWYLCQCHFPVVFNLPAMCWTYPYVLWTLLNGQVWMGGSPSAACPSAWRSGKGWCPCRGGCVTAVRSSWHRHCWAGPMVTCSPSEGLASKFCPGVRVCKPNWGEPVMNPLHLEEVTVLLWLAFCAIVTRHGLLDSHVYEMIA